MLHIIVGGNVNLLTKPGEKNSDRRLSRFSKKVAIDKQIAD